MGRARREGFRRLTLTVFTENRRAKDIYTRQGWQALWPEEDRSGHETSAAAHRALGFVETARIRCFRKVLAPPGGVAPSEKEC